MGRNIHSVHLKTKHFYLYVFRVKRYFGKLIIMESFYLLIKQNSNYLCACPVAAQAFLLPIKAKMNIFYHCLPSVIMYRQHRFQKEMVRNENLSDS